VLIRRITTHSLQAIAEGALIAMLVVGLMAGTAFAGKGGGKPSGGSSTGIGWSMVVDDNGNGVPNWGEQITFRVQTSNPRPVASLTCSQGGSVVYGDSRALYWPNAFDDPGVFTLRSIAWDGGAASCHTTIKGTSSNGRVVTLGSYDFSVGA
jgi:hypothetical protein